MASSKVEGSLPALRWLVVVPVAVALVGPPAAGCGRSRRSSPPLSLELELRSRLAPEPLHRARSAQVGDELIARARGATCVLVYRERMQLVAACPGTASCTRSDRELELSVRLAVPGHYEVLAASAPVAIEPTGDLDHDILRARSLGAHLDLYDVEAWPAER